MPLVDFVFISIPLGGIHRGSCFDLHLSVLPMFSSKSFIVCGLIFRSLIHFEFIFVYGVRKCCSFILLQVVDQFSQHHLLKRLSFFHCIVLPPSLLFNMLSTLVIAFLQGESTF